MMHRNTGFVARLEIVWNLYHASALVDEIDTNEPETMTLDNTADVLADLLAQNLPYLRRYARALTGTQTTGDALASRVIERVVDDPDSFDPGNDVRVMLFRLLHMIRKEDDIAPVTDTADPEKQTAAHRHLARLTPDTREALLMRTIEGFSNRQIAQIMDMDAFEVAALIEIAHAEMASSVAGRVMIIEDEAIIAMELEGLVTEMGHTVTGVARTYANAITLADADPPDLILADIQLADQSSGIDAVNDVTARLGDVLVIFVTAFPERLLTGNRPEPAFLISKPYDEDQVRSAVSQAMFFSTTEQLVL